VRYFVRVFAAVVFVSLAGAAITAQQSASAQNAGASGVASQQISHPVPQSVQDAEALIAQSSWKAAEEKLNGWLADHPSDARALFDAGYAADAENHLDLAAAFYKKAVAADASNFMAHLSLGLLLARQGKLDEARPELVAATKLDTSHTGEAGQTLKAQAWRALAQIDHMSDHASDPTAASNDLMEALKLSPETPQDTLLAAQLAEEAGEPDAAEKAYRRLLADDPKSEQANAGLAHLLIARKQFPEAETLLRRALETAPDDPALTAQLAVALAAQDKGEALPLLEKLHAAHPENAAITRMLAEVRAEAGDTSGSDQLYMALLAASPRDPELLAGHGQNLIQMQRFAEAFDVFTKATQAAPSDGDAWSGLAFAASKTNRPAAAIHALTERAKLLPDNASTYFLWATSYDAIHDRAQATSYYHHFLDAAGDKFPDQEWQARQRLTLLEKK
jgi:predicted Zn-dependent protease